METVLFFISSTRHTCTNRLEGICHYAHTQGWYVQVVERAFHKVFELLKNPRQSLDSLLDLCGYPYRKMRQKQLRRYSSQKSFCPILERHGL
jgi:hypothetical protein